MRILILICIATAMALLSAAGRQKTDSGDAGRPTKPTVSPEAASAVGKRGEPGLHLRTSGVRGSLDSGGYSAPAAAKSESVLIDRILRLQLETLQDAFKVAVIFPCGFETSLRRTVERDPEEFRANYQIGQFYLQHAKAEKARAYLKVARRLNAQDLDTALLLAVADLRSGGFSDASKLLRDLVSRNDNLRLRLLLGIAEEGRGKFEAAEEQFRSAAKSAPTEPNLFAWGSVLLLLGRIETAGDVFRTALAQFPRSTVLMVGLGGALYEQANVEEARKVWFQAAEVNPNASAPYLFIANTLNSSDIANLSETAEKFSALVKTAPNNPEANYAYACLLLAASGNAPANLPVPEIESMLQRAVALNPAFPEAHFKLASFYGERGQYTLAIREYRKAIECDPDLAEAHYRLGQIYMRTGDKDRAERELAQHRKLRDAHQQNIVEQDSPLLKALAMISGSAKTSCSREMH
jgi:tetratricopeptide (TPR) repeat protein